MCSFVGWCPKSNSGFIPGNFESQKNLEHAIKYLKHCNNQPGLIYPTKLSSILERKTLCDISSLRMLTSNKSNLRKL